MRSACTSTLLGRRRVDKGDRKAQEEVRRPAVRVQGAGAQGAGEEPNASWRAFRLMGRAPPMKCGVQAAQRL